MRPKASIQVILREFRFDAFSKSLKLGMPKGTFPAMRDQLQIFDTLLEKRRRGAWKWSVFSAEGQVIVQGSDVSRRAARYNANRALFQLLLGAPYRSKRSLARKAQTPHVLDKRVRPNEAGPPGVYGNSKRLLTTSNRPAINRSDSQRKENPGPS